MSHSLRFMAAALVASLAACEIVLPSNPFDPGTPAAAQATATLRGVIVLDDASAADSADLAAEAAAVVVTLADAAGRTRADDAGDPLRPTLTVNGNRVTFVATDVEPGDIRLGISGVPARFVAPAVVSLTLFPGDAVDVGDVVFQFQSVTGGPGSIDGVVKLGEGSGAERSITLFRRVGVGSEARQEQVGTPVQTNGGAFSFTGLGVGTYAVAATLAAFTPDYRADIQLSAASPEGLARTFSGDESLTLHPITAVLLPQLDRTDGNFYSSASEAPLAVLAFGGVTGMKLTAVACTLPAPDCAFPTFDESEPFAPYSAAASQAFPPDTEGRLGIFAQFEARSAGGFVFTSPLFSTTIIHDTVAPTIRSLARLGEGPAAEVLATESTLPVDVEVDDASGIAAVGFGIAADEPDPAALAFTLVSTSPGSARLDVGALLPAGDGIYNLWFFVRDRAGNTSTASVLRVRKDTQPADALPIVFDSVIAGEGRAVTLLFHFDAASVTSLPTSLQVGVGVLPSGNVGVEPFDPATIYAVTTNANDNQSIIVRARLLDEVGNATEVFASTTASLRGSVEGTIDTELLGSRRERLDTIVSALGPDGATLAVATTDALGAFAFPSLREGTVAVVANRGGYRSSRVELGFVEAGSTVPTSAFLSLKRGALVGRFRKQDLDEVAGVHGGITVTASLVSQTRSATPLTVTTGPEGDWFLDSVAANVIGESWTLTGTADGYGVGVSRDNVVDDNTLAVVEPATDPALPTAIQLPIITGDFDLCSLAQAGGPCNDLGATNQSRVRVHLRNATSVTRIRAAVDVLPDEAILPLQTFDRDNDVVVALPALQGTINIVVEIERDGARQTIGPGQVLLDTIPPESPDVSIARGRNARRDGFTNEPFVVVTVAAKAADFDDASESGMARAPTFFSPRTPTSPVAGGALCVSSGATPCTVVVSSIAGVIIEQTHDLYAFACDLAGNCSVAPGTSSIVYDATPPSALHGLALQPSGDRVVPTGAAAFLTASGAYVIDINVGAALTGDTGDVVLDPDGNAMRDIEAVAFSFVGAIDATLADNVIGGGGPDKTVQVPGLQLLGGEADYDIFAVFVDAAGNSTSVEPNPFTFRLTLDQTAPNARLVLQDDATASPSLTVTVRLDELSESSSFKLVADVNDCRDDADYVAARLPFADHTLLDKDGEQLVVACLRDLVGNASFSADRIVLDRVAPTGTVVLDGGNESSADRTLLAAFSPAADVITTKAALSRAGTDKLDCASPVDYASQPPSTFDIPAADGPGSYLLEACFKDAAGNTSAAAAVDTIFFSPTTPVVTLVINDDLAFTTDPVVRVSLAATADSGVSFTTMRFSSTLSFSGPGEGFAASKSGLVLSASSTEGAKTLCVEVTDSVGRVATDCDDVTLDLLAPVGTVAAAAFTTASPFTLSILSDDLNIASAAVGEALDCSSATFTALTRSTSTNRTVTFADTDTESSRSVVACFKDAAGQVARVEKTVFFDPNDPALAQGVAPAAGVVLATKRPQFIWAAVAGANRYHLQVRRVDTGVVALSQANLVGLTFTPGTDLPETPLEWIVVSTKPSGRSSTVSFTDAPKVTPDTTAPGAATLVVVDVDDKFAAVSSPAPCTAARRCLNDATPTVTFTSGTDLLDAALTHIVEVTLDSDGSFANSLLTLTRNSGATFAIPSALEDASYKIRVRSLDDAGNTATSAVGSFLIDRTAPDSPTIFPVKSLVSSVLSGPINITFSSERLTGAATYLVEFGAKESELESLTIADAGGSGAFVIDVKSAPFGLEAGSHVEHVFRVTSIDVLGNRSPAAIVSFANDTTVPCAGNGSGLLVLGDDPANDFSSSSAVVFSIICAGDPADPFDGPFRMQTGCDGIASGKPFVSFTNFATCVLPLPDGEKTVAVAVLDEAGNSALAFTDTIILDRKTPTTPVLSIDEVITNNQQFSFTISEASSDTNFAGHQFIDGVEITSFDDPRGIVLGNTVVLDLVVERTYNVRVRGVDFAGNTSPEAIAKVTLDTTNPTAPVIAQSGVIHVVNANTFTFFLDSDSSDEHFDHYELSTNHCAGSAPCPPSGVFTSIAGQGPFTVALPPDKTTTLQLLGVDEAGNIGLASSITAIEDSLNPRPLELEPLPPFTNGGAPQAFHTPGFDTEGSYVDVHFARAETNVTPTAIDANFDHFEIRATTGAFRGFVALCATATPLCPIPFINDVGTTINGLNHVIFAGTKVVGFRIPMVRGVLNTITLRSIDKAGNISLETETSTTETSVRPITRDDDDEVATSLFGDRLVYAVGATGLVKLREPGSDALLGTADDTVTNLDIAVDVPSNAFGFPVTVVAQAPDVILQTFLIGPTTVLLRHSPGPDRQFSTTGDNTKEVFSNNPSTSADDLLNADQPTAWLTRAAWRLRSSGTDTDIIVRDAGLDDVLGNTDDTFATVADDAIFQSNPQLSGEDLAFFQCDDSDCDGGADPRLMVVNSGPDRRFGSNDDVIRTLTQATFIDRRLPPQLYTPRTPGRAACRNVVAFAGKLGHKGVFVIAAGPDGLFDLDDPAIQVMTSKQGANGGMNGFSLNDDVVIASDFNSPPSLEVVTGGPDGCLTRTVDNISFDSGMDTRGRFAVVQDHRIVGNLFTPTSDLSMLELGAERAIWPRGEGTSIFENIDVDRGGFANGGGGFYDFDTRNMQTAFSPPANAVEKVDANHGPVLHGDDVGQSGGQTSLSITESGSDQAFGTSDDRTIVLSGTHPLGGGQQFVSVNGSAFGLDAQTAVWVSRQSPGADAVPILHSAGPDGLFDAIGVGDDCEVEIATPLDRGYKCLSASKTRMAFQRCTGNDVGCGSTVGPLSVREVLSGNICTGTATVKELVANGGFPDLDGTRFIYQFNGLRVIEPGPDGRLTATADNSDRLLSRTATSISGQARISGDRVVWVDTRFQTARVVLADIADGSERVVSRTAKTNSAPTIEGNQIVWGSATADSFIYDVSTAYIGLQPDSALDAQNPAPTRLRCPDDDNFEENDSRATATTMNSGASVNGIVCAGDLDFFSIDVPTLGCVVRAKAHFIHQEGDVDISLFDASGIIKGSSDGSTNDESITFTAQQAGLFTVSVFGFSGSVENTYDVGVTLVCP